MLAEWALIEADLHEVYGIDARSGVLRARSWIWLRTRIYGLLSADSRIARRLNPPKTHR